MKTQIFIFLITLILAATFSCRKDQPEKMSKEVFSKLYARLMLISETVPATSDSLAHIKQQKIDSLFSAWKTTEKDFRDMVSLYQQTPEEWTEILHMASTDLDSLHAGSK